jgi:hypothetical protein
MRRNYISPEFNTNKVYGTLNMLEESNFFGAKMLEVEDSLLISNENFVWYEMTSGEQIDFDTETTIDPKILSSSDTKKELHRLYLDEAQTQYTKDNSTNWIMDINLSDILSKYIYAKIKNRRTFEGIRSNTTIYNDVNQAIYKYIELNVLNRYKISRIDLYLSYVDLKSQNVLRFQCNWNDNIVNTNNLTRKFQTVFDFDFKNVRLTFKQERPSTQYKFDYFFNLFFEKI